jgi:hypothetical protein
MSIHFFEKKELLRTGKQSQSRERGEERLKAEG